MVCLIKRKEDNSEDAVKMHGEEEGRQKRITLRRSLNANTASDVQPADVTIVGLCCTSHSHADARNETIRIPCKGETKRNQRLLALWRKEKTKTQQQDRVSE